MSFVCADVVAVWFANPAPLGTPLALGIRVTIGRVAKRPVVVSGFVFVGHVQIALNTPVAFFDVLARRHFVPFSHPFPLTPPLNHDP